MGREARPPPGDSGTLPWEFVVLFSPGCFEREVDSQCLSSSEPGSPCLPSARLSSSGAAWHSARKPGGPQPDSRTPLNRSLWSCSLSCAPHHPSTLPRQAWGPPPRWGLLAGGAWWAAARGPSPLCPGCCPVCVLRAAICSLTRVSPLRVGATRWAPPAGFFLSLGKA